VDISKIYYLDIQLITKTQKLGNGQKVVKTILYLIIRYISDINVVFGLFLGKKYAKKGQKKCNGRIFSQK